MKRVLYLNIVSTLLIFFSEFSTSKPLKLMANPFQTLPDPCRALGMYPVPIPFLCLIHGEELLRLTVVCIWLDILPSACTIMEFNTRYAVSYLCCLVPAL